MKLIKILNLFLVIASLVLLGGCNQNTATVFKNENSNPAYPVLVKDDSSPEANLPIEGAYGENSPHPLSILFLGDVMFDRHIRQAAEKQGNDFIFEKIKNLLTESDLSVANLEGPITDNKSVSVGSKIDTKNNFIFTFDPSLAKTLAAYQIKIVNLGNNHIFNFGAEGIAQTKKYLDAAKVEHFGDISADNSETLTKEIDGLKLFFVNYNYAANGSRERALADIRETEEQSGVTIVYTHWGTEYRTGNPEPAIRNLAREFVDAGADLIIGAHPHVIQNSEEYQGKKIYYSLGNFIFDQYFSPETQKGLAVKVWVNPKDYTMEFQEIPLRMQKNCQTVEITDN
ncbi:MAG: CapA family protein [Candidatus Moranbacteria bacterium]|nr:CapA family protein [Candidatus Moranbacteria bacterium]